MQFHEDVLLAQFTTFGIGGPARWFGEALVEADIVAAVDFARSHSLRLFVLGGGSNLLVSDRGFNGLVVKIGLLGRSIADDPGPSEAKLSILTAAAGEDWDQLVTYAVDLNLAGMECLAGIPGTVGGTPVQNVGAYGQEVSQTIASVRALDLERNAFVDLDAAECAFSYRRSLFNSTARGRYVVTRVSYRLKRGAAPTISYVDLKRFFQDRQPPSGLKEVADAVREIRRQKGMLLVPGDPDCRSAGSFFKNPIVAQAVYRHIAAKSATAVPSYPAADGMVKIPAAWLVEQAGFAKGYELGRAGISSRHTLALINRGGARAAEIVALRDSISAAVQAEFGIQLDPEPVWVE